MAIMVTHGNLLGMATIKATLLSAKTTTDTTGEWVDTGGFQPLTLQFEGITTGTVQVRGSNSPTRPATNENEFQLGTDITANGMYVLCAPVRWIKVLVTVATSISLNVHLWGARG